MVSGPEFNGVHLECFMIIQNISTPKSFMII